MATHSSVLAWRIPGTGEPGGLPSVGSHRVEHNWSDLAAAAATATESMLQNINKKPPQNGSPKQWKHFYVKFLGSSLVAWWRGFRAFHAVALVQTLVRELRFWKLCGVVKRRKHSCLTHIIQFVLILSLSESVTLSHRRIELFSLSYLNLHARCWASWTMIQMRMVFLTFLWNSGHSDSFDVCGCDFSHLPFSHSNSVWH